MKRFALLVTLIAAISGCVSFVDRDRDGTPDFLDATPTAADAAAAAERDANRPGLFAAGSDRDGDGTTDDIDKCINDPEDFDGFEDEDGCPEPDNDRDGISDADDKCPMEPEDKDGTEDQDGCPEAGPAP